MFFPSGAKVATRRVMSSPVGGLSPSYRGSSLVRVLVGSPSHLQKSSGWLDPWMDLPVGRLPPARAVDPRFVFALVCQTRYKSGVD